MNRKSIILLIVIPFLLFSGMHAQVLHQRVNEKENILKLNNNGEIACQLASEKENEAFLRASPKNLNYTIVRSLNDTNLVRDGLKILLRATDQLMANSEALLAFRRAAAVLERHIKVDITTIIDVDFGVLRFGIPWDPGVLGSTSSALYYPAPGGQYQNVTNLVDILKAVHVDDLQLQELYGAIPIPTPTTHGEPFARLMSTFISLQNLGYFEQHANPDDYVFASGNVPKIGFNANFNWDLDPNDGIIPGHYDFDGVVVHEILHAIGFNNISFYTFSGPPNNDFMPWDLFRVRPETVEIGSLVGFSTADRVTTPGPADSEPWPDESGYLIGTHTYFDGINEWECSTSLGDGTGGDGSQSAHWRDDNLRPPSLGEDRYIGIMDPNSGSGVRDTLHYADLRMLEVIGYPIVYKPDFAEISISIDGEINDISLIGDTLSFGNIDINTFTQKTLVISNNNLSNSLTYQVELEKKLTFPDNLEIEVLSDKISSTILPGATEGLILTVGNSSESGIYFGNLRLHTNADQLLVVEIPFEVNIGGAVAPTVSLSTGDLGELKIDDKESDPVLTSSFEISNSGTLPLEYRISTSLSTKSSTPPVLLKSSNTANSVLKSFYSSKVLSSSETLYETDFESDFGGFSPAGDFTEDWNRINTEKATLEGHSPEYVVYYGSLDSMKTKHESKSYLVGPEIDLSSIPPQDMVVFSFNYYLDAEVGFDFAFIDVSLDGGKSFEEIATSNGGILENTTEWQSVIIELPSLSGNPEPIIFRFRFEADTYVNAEGFYFDDISVSTIADVNTMYTSPRAGILNNQYDSQEILLFVNSENLESGYYSGSVLVISNDVKNEVASIGFQLSKLIIEAVTYNKFYASTGRASSSLGRIIDIDPSSAVGTEIGISGFKPVSSITINAESQELYALSNSSGAPTKIIRISAVSGSGLYEFEISRNLNCIAFDDKDNTLYGIGVNDTLYTINLETEELSEIGGIGLKIGAITFNPFTNQLYATVKETVEKDRIYKIDKLNGDTTRVGATGLNTRIEGIAFDADANMFGVYGSEQQISTLIRINPMTGEGVVVGATGYRGVLGLTYSHDPVTIVQNGFTVIPVEFSINQNYPNPFNPSTKISYALPTESKVKIQIFNILGESVATLINHVVAAGSHSIEWNASNLSSGVYLYRISAESASGSKQFNSVKKMILMK